VKLSTEYRKGKISIVLDSSLYEPIFYELVIILNFYTEYFNTIGDVIPKNYGIGYNRKYIRKI
jgi:hypothetical protein